MARQRSTETRIQDAKAVDLRRRGLGYQAIADQLGLRAASSAHAAVKRGMRDLFRDDMADAKVLELERLDDALRTAYRIMLEKHVATNNQGVIYGKDGQPVIDASLNLAAARTLKDLGERRSKLLGMDAPTRTRIETITESDVDAAIRELNEKHAKLAADGVDLAALDDELASGG